jgi:hypothetical protein
MHNRRTVRAALEVFKWNVYQKQTGMFANCRICRAFGVIDTARTQIGDLKAEFLREYRYKAELKKALP